MTEFLRFRNLLSLLEQAMEVVRAYGNEAEKAPLAAFGICNQPPAE